MNDSTIGWKLFCLMILFGAMTNDLQAQCQDGETFFTNCYGNSETDLVIFEVCPTSGMAAEADIIGGTYDDFGAPNDNLSVYQGPTGSGTSGTLVFGPVAGNLVGNTISGNVADQCLIFVSNSDLFGSCADGTELALEVCGRSIAPSVAFTAPDDVCENQSTLTGLSGGSPTGGVYSGTGVTDDGNGMTYSFNPATSGVGIFTITYTLGADTDSDDIEVLALGAVSFTAPADLCIDAGIQTGLGGGMPLGGVYSGLGVIDDGNGMTYSFNPAITGFGVHVISYTESGGCNETAMDNIEVLAPCGCPIGEDNFFYCYGNGESNAVAFEVCPTAGMAAQAEITQGTFDAFDDNLTVYQGLSGSSTSGTILLGPSGGNFAGTTISGNLADNCLIFVINSGLTGSCLDGSQLPLTVCGRSISPFATFTAPADLCVTDPVLTGLGGGSPSGGVYSGPGVTDDGNGMTYSFNPATAGAGVQTLTYTVGANSATDDVAVFAVGAVTFTAPADLCIDAGVQTGLGGGSPAGGVYSGPGVTDDGNGMTYSFNPAFAGLGIQTIVYTVAGACSDATDAVEVLAACSCPLGDQTFFACYDNNETNLVLFEVCPSAGLIVQADIVQGTYDAFDDNLTVYEGVTGSGSSGAVVFGPSNGNLAGNVLMGSAADLCLIFVSNSGGIGSCMDGTELPLIVCGKSLNFTAPADLCVDAGVQSGLSGVIQTGGVFSGTGVTDDGNGMTYSFDPAVAGVGIQTIVYTLSGVVFTDDLEVFALPTVGFTAPAPVSIGSGTQTGLGGGTPTGGTYSGTGVMDDGNGMTYSFDPTIAGVGTHPITYTFTDTNGCTNSASDDIEVLAAVGPSFSKSFSPNNIALGSVSVLTFTIVNNAGTPLSDIDFTDNLPAGMIVATPANVTSNCFSGTVSAIEGGSVISLTDGQITGNGTCTITVNVQGNAVGTLSNTTGELTSSLGNGGMASANLTVADNRPSFSKSFAPTTVNIGGRSTMTFIIDNTNTTI
ncbi:MAG: hypothetical protein AAF985_14250, partial [Bacteroidota bacterium]